MIDFLMLLACVLTRLFRSRVRLEAEILVLRHQLNILKRKSTERAAFKSIDRLVFAGLYRLVTGVLDALKILKPETVIRWHRAGFRAYWRWKSRSRGGRPKTLLEVRQLIRDMSIENPLWDAPRIHGELLKLGIDVGQTTVASTWREEDVRHPKDGRRFFEITRTASRRWICSWSPRSRSGCCMDFWSCGIPASERAGVAVCVVACDAAGEIALLPSPWAPWKGAPLRVMLVTEKPLQGELSLTGPDGSVAATSRERHGF